MPEKSTNQELGPQSAQLRAAALRCAQNPANCECAAGLESFAAALRDCRTNRGKSLYQLSFDLPLLFVFLRHLNCVFTRQTLCDISLLRREIELEGADVVLFHMEPEDEACLQLEAFALADLPRVADPDRRMYRAFDLGCGTLRQLGPRVLWRALSGVLRFPGRRRSPADWSQMPGVFLVYRGEVCQRFRHSFAHDRPNYVSLAAFPLLRGIFTD